MAITVAELLVEIGVDAKAAEKAADGLTKKLKNTEGAAGGAAKGVGKTTKEIDKLGKTSERAGKLAGGLAKVIKGVGVGIAALGTATLTTGATFEKLRAQLKTATGSAEGADEALGFVREFAKNTPFQVEEITGAFIKLTNLGLAPSEEALTAYGDTASAMGKELDQLIEAVADATTGEFERLKEFGIKAKSEGDNVSFTFRGVTTTVGKNSAEIEKYLIDLSKNNFAGAMAEQMGTLNGIISNAKDAIATFFLTVAEMGPLEEFKLLIADIRDAAGGDSKGLAKILADTLTTAIRGVRRLLQGDFLGTLESIASAFKFLVENVDKLIALFAGAKMVQAFSAMASGFTTMGIAAAGALGPIGLIMGALVALIPVAIDLGNKLGEALALKTALRTTTKRGGPGLLTERFATEARAKEAGAQEAIIRKAQSKIEEIESGAYISPNEQVEISKAKQKIRNARSKISAMEEEDATAISLRRELAAQADDPELTQGPQAPPTVTTPKRRRGGGRRKSKAKTKPKSATTLEEVLAADPAQLQSMAASTPSTKAIEPTVAVDITNNNYSFDIDQIIRSNAEPGEVAREAALAIKKEFQTRLAAAGQQLQPNLVR
jgi:hypothetical protein